MGEIYATMKCYNCKHRWDNEPCDKCPECGSDNVRDGGGHLDFMFDDIKCLKCKHRYEVNASKSDGKPCPECGSDNVISRGTVKYGTMPPWKAKKIFPEDYKWVS